MQVARCTKIISPNTEDAKYIINAKQIGNFVVGLGDKVSPTDIEEGKRVGFGEMKKTMRWNDAKDESSSDESSSSSDTEAEESNHSSKKSKIRKTQQDESNKPSDVKSGKKKSGGIDFDALRRHGYKGGLSIMNVPAPKEEEKQDWSWSTGKDRAGTDKDAEESYRERQELRDIVADVELQAADAVARKKAAASFAQKEKRKRDLGQTSRGKNYVEEEKRLLRDNGVYSGFDS